MIVRLNDSKTRGPGYWKLNSSFLSDEKYLQLIEKVINTTIRTYQEHVNPQVLWDMIKLKVRQESISYGIRASKERKFCENLFLDKWSVLKQLLVENPKDKKIDSI